MHVVHLINTSQNVWFWRDREYRKKRKGSYNRFDVRERNDAVNLCISWDLAAFAILTMCSFSFLIRIWGNAKVRIRISFFFLLFAAQTKTMT